MRQNLGHILFGVIVAFLIVGTIFTYQVVAQSLNQLQFQAGSGYEITTGNASQNLDITTKATDGGAINIGSRQGTGIYINTANSIGIGTSAPTTRLSISSSGANGIDIMQDTNSPTQSGRLFFSNQTAGQGVAIMNTGGSMQFRTGATANVSSGISPMVLTSSGYLGINNAGPSYTLDVTGTGRFTQPVIVGTPTGDSHAATKSYVDSAAGGGVGSGSSGQTLRHNGSGWIANDVIYNNGTYVGIGTTNPGAKLDVSGNINAAGINGTIITVGDASITNLLSVGSGGASDGISVDGDIEITGDISIGTVNPLSPLHVQNDTDAAENLARFVNYGGQGAFLINEYRSDGGTSADPLWVLNSFSGEAIAIAPGINGGSIGTTVTYFDDNGNVGIGTASPGYKLDVTGTGQFTQPVIVGTPTAASHATTKSYVDSAITSGIGSGVSGTTNYIAKFTSSSVVGNSQIFDNGTNVGIGTSSPGQKLDINGITRFRNLAYFGNADQFGRITWGGSGFIVNAQSGYNLSLGANGTYDQLIIDTGGKVGIGTTTPANRLTASGTDDASSTGVFGVTTSGGTILRFGGNTTYSWIQSHASKPLVLNELGNNVGIRNNSPSYALDVSGTGSFSQPVIVGTPTAASHAATKSYVDSATVGQSGWTDGGTNVYLTTTSDNVGIGTSSPGAKLDVRGLIYANQAGDYQLQLQGSDTWAGIRFGDSAGADYLWFNGSQKTFALGGGGANVSGKKLHVDGAVTIGSGYDGYAIPTDGLRIQGEAQFDGGVIINNQNSVVKRKFYVASRTLGANAGDYVNIGNIVSAGQGTYAEIYLTNHHCGTINSGKYIIHDSYYVGATTDWLRLPTLSHTSYSGTPDIVVDARRTATHSTPFELRIRNMTGGPCGSGTVTVEIQTNGTFSEDSTSGTGATVAGFLGSTEYQLPVSTNRFSSTTEGLYILNNGNTGIGNISPSYKLDVVGTGSFSQPVIVGTPTASDHAATKSYVDSATQGGGNSWVSKGNCSGTVAIDWSAGNTQHCTLVGATTFTFSGGSNGGSYKLILKQDAGGSKTVTWPGTTRWPSGSAPTLTTTGSKTDYVGFIYNGTDSTYDGVSFNANF